MEHIEQIIKKKPKGKFTKPTVAIKHKKVFDKLVENGGNLAQAIRDTKLYSETVANDPQKITNSKTWNELMEEHLSDSTLSNSHKELLMSTRMDHMVFPLGPKDEDSYNFSGARPNGETNEDMEKYKERTSLTDQEIIALLAEVNCKVRRIVHGETARHVYFWSADNKARKDGLDMAYKLKGKYAPDKSIHLSIHQNVENRQKMTQIAEETATRLLSDEIQ